MLQLRLARKWFTEKSTIGILYVNDKFFCYTLEDVVRPSGEKIKGQTAIPWGTYKISLTYSKKFDKILPLLADVPNFTGVRIHSGNTDKDTEGCILVGSTHSNDFVGSSRVVMTKLMNLLADETDVMLEIAAEATR
jgi:hypothetical protein